MTSPLASGFIPIRLYGARRPFGVDLCHLGSERFEGPFFDDTVQRRLRLPFNQLFRPQVTLDDLVSLTRADPGLPPRGFIFHMSRCGSTLVARMLATLPGTVVLSEPPPVDTLLQLPLRDPSITEDEHVAWLRALISALGQPRQGSESRLFVKLDAWHTLFLPLIRRAFPDVPWIFLHRDPLEVLVSQARQRGSQMLPGVLPWPLLQLPGLEVPLRSLDDYAARLLAVMCRAALDHRDAKARFVPYRALPGAVEGEIASHFGLDLTDEDRARLRDTARPHAKSPGQAFAPDAEAKQQEADVALRALADEWLGEIRTRLESASSVWERPPDRD